MSISQEGASQWSRPRFFQTSTRAQASAPVQLGKAAAYAADAAGQTL